ncbi:MAG: hypothetical protein BRD43_04660 [Bacteroidetes bacterium QS_4_64_154]|nr:MAG: hypothetical protein BRD43_04660 [Bacteroidetes bacterium QS_4_64_154]
MSPQQLSPPSILLGYTAIFAATALVCLGGLWRARRISVPGVRRGLTALLLASGGWAAAQVATLLAPTLFLAVRFYEGGLIVGFATVWAWLYFCSAYSGRSLHRSRAARGAAIAVFGAVALVKGTNPWHGIYFSAEMIGQPFPHLAVDPHDLYWVTTGLSYALAGVGFFMLYESLRQVRVGAGQLGALFGLTVLPVLANVIGDISSWLLNVSHEPVGVAAFALGVLFMGGRRFEEAEQAGGSAKPVLVLSESGRVRDFNARAAALFPQLDASETIDAPLAETRPDVAEALSCEPPRHRANVIEVGPNTSATASADEHRYYRVDESSAGAGRGNRRVVLTDVTGQELRRRKQQREHRSLSKAVEQSNEAVLITEAEPLDDPGPRIVYANAAFEEMTGYDESDLLGRTPRILQGPETERATLNSLRVALEAGESWTGETVNYRKDGRPYLVQWALSPVQDHDGQIEHWVSVQRDVTERKKSRQALERYREHTDRILDTIDDLFFVLGEEGQFRRWNDRISEVTGYADDEIGDMTAFDLVPDDEHERVATKIANAFANGHAQLEVPLVCKDGTTIPYEFAGSLVEHPDGSLQVVGIGRDITERKERAAELERSEQRYRTLTEHFPNGAVGVFDHDLRYTLAEGQLLGTRLPSADRLEGSRVQEVFPEATVADIEPLFRAAVEAGTSDRVETTFGEREWTVWAMPLRDADGEIFAGLSFAQDITERKQQQGALERLNDLFSKAQTLAHVGAWEYNVRSDTAFWTEEVCRIHGLPPNTEVDPEKSLEHYHPDDRRRIKEAFMRAIEEGTSYEIEAQLITADGDQRWVRTRGEPQLEEGEVVRVRGTIRDITERKRQEHSLRNRQEKLEALYETTNQLLQADDREALTTLLVTLVDETLGYSATTIRLAQDDQLVPTQVPSTVQEHMPERPTYDIDGETPAAEAYQTGETRIYDDLSAVLDSMDRGDIRATAYVPMGSYGLISVGSLEVGGIDSFDRRLLEVLASYAALVLSRLEREEELRTAKVEAEYANRMKSAFLANMSHEIRTPLTSVIGFAEAIDDEASTLEDSLETPDLSTLSRFAGLIEQSGQRLLETLDAVLNLSKLQAGEMELAAEAVDLAAEAEAVAERFAPQARETGLALRLDLDAPALHACADAGGVQIVLRNLVSNAIKYTEEGEVRVRTYQEGNEAILEVEDTGIGMDPENVPKLFEPFRQASEGMGREYEGTGLGLAVTKKVTKQMDGRVEMETEKGKGTCVTVRLPKANGRASGA